MVRPMGDRDRFHVMNIDRKGSDFPFDLDDWDVAFAAHKEDATWNITVADVDRTPRAYSFNIIEPERLFIVRIAENPVYEAYGLRDQLMQHELSIATGLGKQKVETLIVEFDLPACDWYAGHGFRCTRTGPGLFSLFGERWDAYHFTLELR